MKRYNMGYVQSLTALFAVTGTLLTSLVFSQPPVGGPGRGPGGRGPGMGRGMMGQPPFMMRRSLSLVQVPAKTIAFGLDLSEEQEKQVSEIQKKYRTSMRSLAGPGMGRPGSPGNPPPGGPPPGGPDGQGGPPPGGPDGQGGPPSGGPNGGGPRRMDPEQMRTMMEKVQKAESAANQKIVKILTADQVKKQKPFLKQMEHLQLLSVSLEAVPELKLTDSQQKEVEKLAATVEKSVPKPPTQDSDPEEFRSAMMKHFTIRQKAADKFKALLTDEQKEVLEKYPAFGMGMRRGPGGGANGGPGGPPPGGPDGGPGGPDDQGGPPPGGPDGGPGGPPPGGPESRPAPPEPPDDGMITIGMSN